MTQAAITNRGGRARPTQCPSGHMYTEASTGYRGNGVRYCRICNRERLAAKRREAGADEQRFVDGDGLLDILAACVRQALIDYAAGADDRPHMSAHDFLDACGLLRPDGTVDYHNHTPPPRGVRRQA